MERTRLLLLLIVGCIVSIVGFSLAQVIPALAIVALIIIAFLYSDIREFHRSGRKDLKKNVAIAVFVALTIFCMITGWWIFWAGITAILYIDALVDSIKEWIDGRTIACLYALKMMQPPGPDYSGTLQSIKESILDLEKLVKDLDQEKGG